MITAKDILMMSSNQGYTCMYSEKELKSFSQEKLDNIFIGIREVAKHRSYRKISPSKTKAKKKSKKKKGAK